MNNLKIEANIFEKNYTMKQVMQNDDIILEISPINNGVLVDLIGATLTLNWLNADNTIVVIDNSYMSISYGKVIVNLPRDCTRIVGIARFELVIINSNKQKSTFPFTIEVIGSVYQNQEASKNVATVIEKIVEANTQASTILEQVIQTTKTINNLITSGGTIKSYDETLKTDSKYVIGGINEINETLTKKIDYKNSFPIEYYGGKANNSSFDNYNAYIRAINDEKCISILLSKGQYYFSKIVLYNGKNIVGLGVLSSEIVAMNSSEPNFIYLNNGPIAYSLYKGLKIAGNKNNPNQNGFYAYGLPQDAPPYHGGFWCNIMQDVYISNFTGVQMHFEGYDPRNNSLVPNQFCTFINVRAFGDSTSKNVIEILPQNGQFVFTNCQFDNATTGYYNIYAKNVDLLFNILTCQHSDNGVYQEGGTITMLHPWFEVCKNPITTNNKGTTFGGGLTIEGGTFRNCAMDEGTRICKTSSRSMISFNNILFMGNKVQTVFENESNEISTVIHSNLYFGLGYTTMFTKTYNVISAINGVLKINTNKMNYVSSCDVTSIVLGNYATSINEIFCMVLGGSTVNFTGTNFINPMSVTSNKYFKLNLIDGKCLIQVLN